MSTEAKGGLRPRVRDGILQALRAGVTPRYGLQHLQVGRLREVETLLEDIERIADGGAAIRFIVGEYGSGKSFFLQLIRSIALEKGAVCLHADLAPDRRLHASGGQARMLHAELLRNCSTRSKPEGGALGSVVERFIAEVRRHAGEAGMSIEQCIEERLHELSESVGGYDFAMVIAAYWQGYERGCEQLRDEALRWLRGEFSTRTEARKSLGVGSIVDDGNVYDRLKLLARFVRRAGYAGLLVCIDELVNLYKLPQRQTRLANYEQILRMLNDCLQGSAEHLGFLFGGTPEVLFDTGKGLFSYEALRSRLEENNFARRAGVVDYAAPVLRLANLTPEELYLLLCNIRLVHANGDPGASSVPDEALDAFVHHCSRHIGDAYFRTPRNTIKAFVDFLSVLDQHPDLQWSQLLGMVRIEADAPSDMPGIVDEDDDALADFRL